MSGRDLLLPPRAAAFVEAGGRDLPLALAAPGRRTRPGALHRLRDDVGRALGLALADPENDRLRVMVAPDEPFDGLDAEFFAARVAAALETRRRLDLVGRETAYRLLNGAGDGLPGLAADVYAGWAVLFVYGRALLEPARELAAVLIGVADLHGVVLKLRLRGAAARGELVQELIGAPPPERLVVREGALRFETHLLGGLNVGLFTDMREQREELARLASGRTVLNVFSYTGGLSVAAARAGAAAVTSVDLSAGVQRWARQNFRLNGLDPHEPRLAFEAADAGAYLAAAAAAGRRFDLVLLDPPAFSAARGARFAVDHDYPALIAGACRLMPADALLWLACNARTSALAGLAQRGLEIAERRAELVSEAGLPADHATLPVQPEDRYLQVALYRLS